MTKKIFNMKVIAREMKKKETTLLPIFLVEEYFEE
jgi:hypothetical protein